MYATNPPKILIPKFALYIYNLLKQCQKTLFLREYWVESQEGVMMEIWLPLIVPNTYRMSGSSSKSKANFFIRANIGFSKIKGLTCVLIASQQFLAIIQAVLCAHPCKSIYIIKLLPLPNCANVKATLSLYGNTFSHIQINIFSKHALKLCTNI